MMSTPPHCYDIIHRGMYTLIFVLFFVRVDDNDTVCDVLSQLSHMPTASAIPAGKVDTRSEEETGENCLYRPTNPRFRYPVDVTFRVLPAKARIATFCTTALVANVMILIVLALAAWSATGVVSVMPEDVMGSAYDYAALNTTYTVASDSSADMESSYPDNKQDERGNEIPETIETILKKFLPIPRPGQPWRETLKLVLRIKNKLVKLPKSSIESNAFSHWLKNVNSLYVDSPEVADKAMFEVLTHHFENDYNFASALIPMKNQPAKKETIKTLLNLQVKKWLDGKQDEASVFELLELQKPNGNPFESPVFFQWVAFIEAKYPGNYDKTIEKMFDVLAKHFVGDHLTKILLVGAKSKLYKTKGLAQSLLNIQVQNWVYVATISDREGFDLLQLHETNGNPLESSVFPKWVNLVKQRYSVRSDEAYEAMLDILADQFESTNALIGALVVGAETHGTKQVAQKLLEYQYKKWKEENKSADDVFEILELTESNLFSSPAFSAWIGFVSSRSSDDQEATKTMITTLEGVCKNGLGKVLAEGTQIKRTKLIAENLQKALKEKLPESSKRQNDFGSDEPPAKRHEFDLSEALPESI